MNIEITTALIGVGSTIVGTVLGWILNHLSSKGKLNIYASWDDCFFKQNNYGADITCNKRNEAKKYYYHTAIDVYNSSGNTRIMRNIKIAFSDGKNIIESDAPKDMDTKRKSELISLCDDIGNVNIPPKVVIKLNLQNAIWLKEKKLDFIWKTKKVYLVYTDEKNRERKKLIRKEDYENFFDIHIQEV